MQCPACQHENAADIKFCGECGTRLVILCSDCGARNGPTQKFCGECGKSLVLATSPPRASDAGRPISTPSATDAERRQLTVMFCDLVDSTQLASRLDPEVLREIVRSYQHACGEVVSRFGGHVAQYLGDGLLVYFGYPIAHEDDAQRAVGAALETLTAIERLNATLLQKEQITLAVRLGIHTGLVVVGEVGGAWRQETLALGETPNIAARLQALAPPNTVLVSGATHRLLQRAFVCHDAGAHAMKGLSEPVRTYRVESGTSTADTHDLPPPAHTALVGREQEVGLLVERWARAREGLGHVVLLTGEPGIGKSRLVRALKETIAGIPHTRWECRCSAFHQDSALYPIVNLFERALEFTRDDTADERRLKIEVGLRRYGLAAAEAVALWTALLSVPPGPDQPPLILSPQRQKQSTFDAIVALMLALAREAPLLIVIEDLHWCDPSTRELLDRMLDQVPSVGILVVLTARPEFQLQAAARTHVTQLTLNRLTHKQTEVMVERLTAGKRLPADVLLQVIAKTDGVPLFVEELMKMVLESGLLLDRDDRYELAGVLPPLAIPSTLQDSLMARLDRLATVKEVAQIGAALGRTFSYALLKTVAPLDDAALQRALTRLVEAEILYQRGVSADARYMFKHALIQETAYQSMLMSRRQLLHQRIAQALTDQFSEITSAEPEIVAHHYTEAGLSREAIEYWRRAGERAVQRSASIEALAHFNRGLHIVRRLPDGPERLERELELQTAVGLVLMSTKGFGASDVADAYARARELCQQIGDTPRLFSVLRGLWEFYELRGDARTGRELADQILQLAERSQDRTQLVIAHDVIQDTCLWLGEYASTRSHMEQAIALYDPVSHRSVAFQHGGYDPLMACRAFGGHALWYLGYVDQARDRQREALEWAQELSHPFTLVFARSHAAVHHVLRGEGGGAEEDARIAIALAKEHGLEFWVAHATIPYGWALVVQGRETEGTRLILEGLSAYRATGSELERSWWIAILAEAYGKTGRWQDALAVLDEALADIDRTGIRFHEPELLRLKGESLRRSRPDADEQTMTLFQHAIDLARRRDARSLELRATMSASRLLGDRGKREDGRRLLADVYSWFTEGFDTKDLCDAKTLLTELSGPP